MFTGIIQSLGKVLEISTAPDGVRLKIDLGALDIAAIHLGDSIAVNGACLTVTKLEGGCAIFDVSLETLDKCLIGGWQVGDGVNLEPALTLGTPLGGHLVSGHVDGTASLLHTEAVDHYTVMRFSIHKPIGRFIAAKGSVAVDGISLTTNTVRDEHEKTLFEVMLVPHTLANTTLGGLSIGADVHVEIDMIARYLNRLAENPETSDPVK